eukprot:TRINITY_DN20500_c0_g1_i13.p2 TRINITY_DN20500_c0_g1~~TRINITY_DN20500_c0_g1_i13.p2  ORF type:complete len:166 (+),score=41.16 TRINITY_DN20500_c0_g1_i13:310-807(+)
MTVQQCLQMVKYKVSPSGRSMATLYEECIIELRESEEQLKLLKSCHEHATFRIQEWNMEQFLCLLDANDLTMLRGRFKEHNINGHAFVHLLNEQDFEIRIKTGKGLDMMRILDLQARSKKLSFSPSLFEVACGLDFKMDSMCKALKAEKTAKREHWSVFLNHKES